MNDQIKIFIEELRKYLYGLPENEIREAIVYYEEYLSDSLDSGRTFEDIIEEIGTAKKIADAIRIETNIQRSDKNPGLINFSRLIKASLGSLTAPLSIFGLSIAAIITYVVFVLIFISAGACAIAGVSVVLLCIFQGLALSMQYFLEVLGTFGMGFLVGGLLLILSYYLWKLGKLLIKLATKQLALVFKLSGKTPKTVEVKDNNKYFPWVKRICIASVIGFVLFCVSGIPWRFFVIFNSMKVGSNLVKVNEEFYVNGVDKIQIYTAHSRVNIGQGTSDKIVLSYEQPDWLEYQINTLGGVLEFRESSNGRLPLFELFTLHSSETKLTVLLPKDFEGEEIQIETRGGYVDLVNTGENVNIDTTTGYVTINTSGSKSNINAKTGIGKVLVNDKEVGSAYKNEPIPGNSLRIVSDSGWITIKE
jgi:uncharacterized membrane protein